MADTVPEIAGIPFRSALLIDNAPDEVMDLESDLRSRGMCTVLARDYKGAQAIIQDRPEINVIVLDWYLNEEDSMESKLLLDHVKDNLFAPVLIYTKQSIEEPNSYVKERGLGKTVRVFDKSKVDCDSVFNEMRRWIDENPELKIFLKWSFQVEKTLNAAVWRVHDLELGGLKAVLELAAHEEDASHTPAEHDLVGLLLKVLSRRLSHNKDFFASIREDFEELMGSGGHVEADVDTIRMFHEFERYIRPPVSEPIWTGDILKNGQGEYSIVVTPVCDLCQPGNIGSVLLLKAMPLKEFRKARGLGSSQSSNDKVKKILANRKTVLHYLPHVEGCEDGLVCLFDQIASVELEKAKGMISKGDLTRIVTIDSPFIENLVQRMNAYLMRLGVRNLTKEEIERLLEDTA